MRLGSSAVWVEDSAHGAIPAGQKIYLADDAELPLLEIRDLEFHGAATDDSGETNSAGSGEEV